MLNYIYIFLSMDTDAKQLMYFDIRITKLMR